MIVKETSVVNVLCIPFRTLSWKQTAKRRQRMERSWGIVAWIPLATVVSRTVTPPTQTAESGLPLDTLYVVMDIFIYCYSSQLPGCALC